MFTTLLSPASRQKLERLSAERRALYDLDNVGLANALVRMAREAAEQHPEFKPSAPTYEASLLFELIPTLAHRLGAPEAAGKLLTVDNKELRYRLGNTLSCLSPTYHSFVMSMLSGEPCNGNPLVYAIDRLQPGDVNDKNDRIAFLTAEVAHSRGTPYNGVWTPEILKSEN